MRLTFLCAMSLAAVASAAAQTTPGCDAGNAGLTLPKGFCAGIFARDIPAPRHMAVAANGDIFVITSVSNGRGGAGTPARGVFRLRDANKDGKADAAERVADGTGSSLWIANGALYAEAGGAAIVRYPFKSGTTDLTGAADTIVNALPNRGGHTTRDFVVRGNELFVNVGSATNICDPPRPPRTIDPASGQPVARPTGPVPSPDPCIELETRAGIWKFDATKAGQVFTAGARYATGIRNAVGMTINPQNNEVYTTQHGRDNLIQWNNNTNEYNAENPGEEFFHVVQNGDYGWPYCYYSHAEKKKVTGPEYGGDGKKDSRCTSMQKPVYAFPGHWAPNAAMFYSGTQFPAEYRGGVFVAFHGSWNRAPLPQMGFNVTFLPMKDGKATGDHKVFADGFYGADLHTVAAGAHRPTGLAMMSDGSLLVSDDAGNLIYRIIHTGR